MFKKILIANRGEIACRIIKTAKRMGIQTVSVYSSADAQAQHVLLADEAYCIGEPQAAKSYLVGSRIIEVAKQSGAQAIHPGYGFLSENDEFAALCESAGVVFIGPSANAIRLMGSKSSAKALMQDAGVTLTPGYHGADQSPELLKEQAALIGYPVLIKASAGGGGKGIRLVEAAQDFEAALESCQREALNSFGNAQVLVEKYIQNPRHIEVQVFGDTHQNYVYLFERDCSVQRRHQKVIEEAPAPGVSAQMRERLGQAAIAAAKSVNYCGAGTVEFIVSPEGEFYFMEMNTRLQVEHPVTEMITGLDLVEWQLRIASGEPLPLSQSALGIKGHSVEARIYAEDPQTGFLPSIGQLVHLQTPAASASVRIDKGVVSGDSVSPYYDPMIAKLIVWGEDRGQALARMSRALAEFHVVGVASNINFLARVVASESFQGANLSTNLIEKEGDSLFEQTTEPSAEALCLAAVFEWHRLARARAADSEGAAGVSRALGSAQLSLGWRLNAPAGMDFSFQSKHWSKGVRLELGEQSQPIRARITGEAAVYSIKGFRVGETADHAPRDNVFRVGVETDLGWMHALVWAKGKERYAALEQTGKRLSYAIFGLGDRLQSAQAHSGELRAPMPGRVVLLKARAGERVQKGDVLLVMEAMKMEHSIVAPKDGVIESCLCKVGDQIQEGADLITFEA